jgi:phage shock protein PspC (stress-responsive transcriptional regulator)
MVRAAWCRHAVVTMTNHLPPNDNDPTPEPEKPAAEEPTTERPAAEAPTTEPPTADQSSAQQPEPRRLHRSRDDRVIAGVCGGLARYLNVDPVIVRVTAVALVFAGGAGIFLYLAAFLLVPNEGEGGAPGDPPRRAVVIAGAVALAVALPAGVVSAAGIDVTGGHGERSYRPATSDAVRSSYRLGAGKLVVDLRGAHLTPGDHRVKLRLGVGDAQLIVPRDVCVSTASHLGAGGVQVFDRDGGGIDVDWQDERRAPAGTPRVVVDADVGIGAFTVHHEASHGWDGEPGNEACA